MHLPSFIYDTQPSSVVNEGSAYVLLKSSHVPELSSKLTDKHLGSLRQIIQQLSIESVFSIVYRWDNRAPSVECFVKNPLSSREH